MRRGGYGGARDDFHKIENNQKRITTFSKRKKNLFKKAIELSILCGVDIFIIVFDRDRQKFYELNTTSDFDIQMINYMLDTVNRQQFYSRLWHNKDYNFFCTEGNCAD